MLKEEGERENVKMDYRGGGEGCQEEKRLRQSQNLRQHKFLTQNIQKQPLGLGAKLPRILRPVIATANRR